MIRLKWVKSKMLSYLKSVFMEVVLTIVLWLILLAILLPMFPILVAVVIARNVETFIYRTLYNATAFKSEDVLWLMDTPKNRYVINGLTILDSVQDMKKLRNVIKSSLLLPVDEQGQKLYPKATQHVFPGWVNHYWIEDSNFAIEKHVFQMQDTVVKSERDLQKLISSHCSTDLLSDRNSSPWEFISIPYEEKGVRKTALLLRMSHAIADGSSLFYYLTHHLADGFVLSSENVKKFTQRQRKLMKLEGLFYLPLTYVKMMFLPSDQHALHCNDVTGNKNMSWTKPINLMLVKKIKNKLKVTVHDVLIGCLAVALHNYFKKKKYLVPKDLTMLIPVDIRSNTEDAKTFQNNIATLILQLPSGMKHSMQAIQETKKRTNLLKNSGDAFSIDIGWKFASYFLPLVVAKGFIYDMVDKTTGIVSSVIGPQEPIKIDGHTIELITFWPPQSHNAGIGISFCSYNGTLRVGIETDDVLTKSPKELCDNFETVFHKAAQAILYMENHKKGILSGM